jgi:hypothetical protein
MRIADELVQQLRLDGRRFLQFHQGDNVWRDVGDEKARQKVIQTWRDSAPSTVAQSDSGVHLPSELLKVSSQPPVHCCMHCRVRLGVIYGAHSHPSFCLLSRRSSNSAEESTSKTLSRYDWSQQQSSVIVASGAHPCLLHPSRRRCRQSPPVGSRRWPPVRLCLVATPPNRRRPRRSQQERASLASPWSRSPRR